MIWLIGCNGMLGSDLAALFQQQQIPLLTSDLEVDITNINKLREFVKDQDLDWIINCSAYTNVDGAEDDMEKAFLINSGGVKNITQVAKEKDAALIHISTDYVFNGEQGNYTEDDPVDPIGVYGDSKLKGEEVLRSMWFKHYILRTAWLYGKNGKNFVTTMLNLFNSRNELTVVNDQVGSPTYTQDLAQAILTITQSPAQSSQPSYGIYNYTNEGKTTWYDFACEIYNQAKAMGKVNQEVTIKPVPSSAYPTKAKRPANSFLIKDKIKKTFQLAIPSWQDGLVRYLKEI